ncbi:MAG: hypothetical protein K0Q95_1258 [Bacteroidota bacterium]|jgi:hypothetical protein|nr:hypothetical protein [Bacteroidota bacterium]
MRPKVMYKDKAVRVIQKTMITSLIQVAFHSNTINKRNNKESNIKVGIENKRLQKIENIEKPIVPITKCATTIRLNILSRSTVSKGEQQQVISQILILNSKGVLCVIRSSKKN